MARVVKTERDYPTLKTNNPDGKFVYVEMDYVPLDFLFEQLARSAVMERRRTQVLYPRLDMDAIDRTIRGG